MYDLAWFSRVFWRGRKLTERSIFNDLVEAYKGGDSHRIVLLTNRAIEVVEYSEEGERCIMDSAGRKNTTFRFAFRATREDDAHYLYHTILRCPKVSAMLYTKGHELDDRPHMASIRSILNSAYLCRGVFGEAYEQSDDAKQCDVEKEKKRSKTLIDARHFSSTGCLLGGGDTTQCCIDHNEDTIFFKKHLLSECHAWKAEANRFFTANNYEGGIEPSNHKKYDLTTHNRVLDLCAQRNPRFLRYILPAAVKDVKKYLETHRTPHREAILDMLEEHEVSRDTIKYPYGEYPQEPQCALTWVYFFKGNTARSVEVAVRTALVNRDKRTLLEIIQHQPSRRVLYERCDKELYLISTIDDSSLVEDGIKYFKEMEKKHPSDGDENTDEKSVEASSLHVGNWTWMDFVALIVGSHTSVAVMDWLGERYSSEHFFQRSLLILYGFKDLYNRDNVLAQRVIYYMVSIPHVNLLVNYEATLSTVEMAMRKCKQDINDFISNISISYLNGEKIILALHLLPGDMEFSSLGKIYDGDVDSDVVDEGESRYRRCTAARGNSETL